MLGRQRLSVQWRLFVRGVLVGLVLYWLCGSVYNSHIFMKRNSGDEFKWSRKPLLSVVVVPAHQVENVMNILQKTWGERNSSYKIALGKKKKLHHENDDIFLFQNVEICPNFLSEGVLSAKDVFCLLQSIHDAHIQDYRWFQIVTMDVYVASSRLERLLEGFDSQSLIYMGKSEFTPALHNYYCLGGPGIILSWYALQQLSAYMKECDVQERWDISLGRCLIEQLKVSCLRLEKASRYFIEDKELLSMPPKKIWTVKNLVNMITLHPIIDGLQMELIHGLVKAQEIIYHQNMARELREMFSYPQLCRNSSDCVLLSKGANYTQNFTLPPCTGKNSDYDSRETHKRVEIIDWDTIIGNTIYTTKSVSPSNYLYGERKLELELASRRAIEMINQETSGNYKLKKLVNAYVRYRGSVGNEFILDLHLKGKNDILTKRISLIRPHSFQIIKVIDAPSQVLKKKINFIVPLSNVNKRFLNFIKVYKDTCIASREACCLHLVVYGEKDIARIRTEVERLKKKYSIFEFKIIAGKGNFSRGSALHQGISSLQEHDLAFLCDVDMSLNKAFLNRCRQNAIEGKRVYFPEVFKFYNLSYVYWMSSLKKQHVIDERHGHWGYYGYGMLCIYKSDYIKIGGYNTKIKGWGGEDDSFVESTIKKGYEIFRAPEPALTHHWHSKICNGKNLSRYQLMSCYSSRNEVLGGRVQLASYIYSLEKHCKVKH